MRILVVDDNTDIAESLSVLLGLEGHDVRAAFSGESAMSQARQFVPDVVILDLLLPDMDGYELAARLKAEPSCRSTRVIGCSGAVSETAASRARATGMDVVLLKPFDPQALLRILEHVNDVPGRGREPIASGPPPLTRDR